MDAKLKPLRECKYKLREFIDPTQLMVFNLCCNKNALDYLKETVLKELEPYINYSKILRHFIWIFFY